MEAVWAAAEVGGAVLLALVQFVFGIVVGYAIGRDCGLWTDDHKR